ncbi:uncharacterized protein L3040_006483 [Drepanopeziza brunnea f. sp. 'multigermtubi']|nr:hypothetical protein L3040_006483 [Drepanopeziza brunnea f. sp. 'multigermtubi']
MAALVALMRSCIESFKSTSTSRDFGEKYELLCTELSIQWLRLRLWGESMGLHFDDEGHLKESLVTRSDIDPIVTRCLNTIAFLLNEIEIIRRGYELKPPLELIIPESCQSTENSINPLKLLERRSTTSQITTLYQRMKENQKQKSLIAITKWMYLDAKRFDEKVKKLKGLIDGLEGVSRTAGVTRQIAAHTRSPTVRFVENPPPYSINPPPTRAGNRITPNTTTPRRAFIATNQRELPRHCENLNRHVKPNSNHEEARRARTQQRLLKLTDTHLYELRIDVHDEMCRREQEIAPAFLPENVSYHPKRNYARKRISTLPPHRFRDLAEDLVFELERRFPSLWSQTVESEPVVHLPDPFSIPRTAVTRRYGCVLPPNVPPPLLRYQAAQNGTALSHVHISPLSELRPSLPSRFSPSSTTLEQVGGPARSISKKESSSSTDASGPGSHASISIFKPFRVSKDDSTRKVLPAALRMYDINAPLEQYSLFITHGNKERCLGMDEKPLILFRQLCEDGERPVFMLRKVAPDVIEIS